MKDHWLWIGAAALVLFVVLPRTGYGLSIRLGKTRADKPTYTTN